MTNQLTALDQDKVTALYAEAFYHGLRVDFEQAEAFVAERCEVDETLGQWLSETSTEEAGEWLFLEMKYL